VNEVKETVGVAFLSEAVQPVSVELRSRVSMAKWVMGLVEDSPGLVHCMEGRTKETDVCGNIHAPAASGAAQSSGIGALARRADEHENRAQSWMSGTFRTER
jgi:hypothetical protein